MRFWSHPLVVRARKLGVRTYKLCAKQFGRFLCGFSRGVNYLITGRRTAICTDAYVRGYERWRRFLDVIMIWRDRRDHTCKSAAQDSVDGMYDGPDFGLDCRSPIISEGTNHACCIARRRTLSRPDLPRSRSWLRSLGRLYGR